MGGNLHTPVRTNPVIEQVPGIQPTRARVVRPLLWDRHHAGHTCRPPEYRRREPERSRSTKVLAGHLETFLQQAGTDEHRLPLHVEKEMRAYLECGILAYGFVRARCEDCGASRAVAFSCKKRGFCPRAALKTPWSDGTRHLLLSPMELLEKLAALVPPPRFHLLRYHSVLAPRARDHIVPAKPVAEPSVADGSASAASCGHRLRWATLLARVFSSDLSECAACGGRLRIIAALTDPASIRTCLEGVGLPAMPPPRAPPEPLFEFAA